MIKIISPFTPTQIDLLQDYCAFSEDIVSQLPAEEHALNSCYFEPQSEYELSLLRWENRNLRIQRAFFREFDITPLVAGGLTQIAQDYFKSEIFISQLLYVRTETPQQEREIFMPHFDKAAIPTITVWIPFVDIDTETGGICFEESFCSEEIRRRSETIIHPLTQKRFLQPSVRTGECILFANNILHGGSSAYSRERFSFDLRFACADTARKYNETIDSDFLINARNRYEAKNYSSLPNFRADQLKHLKQTADKLSLV